MKKIVRKALNNRIEFTIDDTLLWETKEELQCIFPYTHTHTHIYIYIYIYIWACVCVKACVRVFKKRGRDKRRENDE